MPLSSLAPIVHVDPVVGDSVSRDARDEDVVDPEEAGIFRGFYDPGLIINRSKVTVALYGLIHGLFDNGSCLVIVGTLVT